MYAIAEKFYRKVDGLVICNFVKEMERDNQIEVKYRDRYHLK